MTILDKFAVLKVDRSNDKSVRCEVATAAIDDLPPGDVVIEVAYSSLNYKDALACQAHPGVVRNLPHVPGIDAAGVVAASDSPDFAAGQPVLVTGYRQGAEVWGGYSQYIRVPADWVVAMPEGFDARHAMTLGTAGFTAAQSVAALERAGVIPDSGDVVVTGSTGGVGLWSVAMLSKLGYRVTAITGKSEQAENLKKLGASEVLGREAVNDESGKPLLAARWAGAIDTVGGNPLSTILRSTSYRGCVAACGLVAGADLPLTVHPFILRGVTLAGIDSAKCPRESRLDVWRRLSGPWRVELPEEWIEEIALSEVRCRVEAMLAGKTFGRTLVRPTVG